jgi:hypothetical protein
MGTDTDKCKMPVKANKMASGPIRISVNESASGVNDRLLDRFGVSLFKFAQVFAVSPLDLILQRPRYSVSLKEIRAARTSMIKVWHAIENDARNYSILMAKLTGVPRSDFSKEDFRKEDGIFDFFAKYYLPRLWIILVHELNRGARQGIGLSKKSIIALGWCNQITRIVKKIDWKLLCDLYDWFWNKIAPYDHYKEWDPGLGIEDYLKNQFHRYRWVGGTEKYHEEIFSMTRNEFFIFMFKIFLLRWREAKAKYPIDKLPITNKELPRFIRNYFIDFYFGRSEGISIFTKSGSLADPVFDLMYFWLRKNVKDNRLPPEDSSIPRILEPFLEQTGMIYEGTEVEDFIKYASSLYLENKVDLRTLPPLIIFPDKTYFSLAF